MSRDLSSSSMFWQRPGLVFAFSLPPQNHLLQKQVMLLRLLPSCNRPDNSSRHIRGRILSRQVPPEKVIKDASTKSSYPKVHDKTTSHVDSAVFRNFEHFRYTYLNFSKINVEIYTCSCHGFKRIAILSANQNQRFDEPTRASDPTQSFSMSQYPLGQTRSRLYREAKWNKLCFHFTLERNETENLWELFPKFISDQ